MLHPKQNQALDSVGTFSRTGASSSDVQDKQISLGKWDSNVIQKRNKEVRHQTPQWKRKMS